MKHFLCSQWVSGRTSLPFRKLTVQRIFAFHAIFPLLLSFLYAEGIDKTSQRVNTKEQEIELVQFLTKLERETGYVFFYKTQELKGIKVDESQIKGTTLAGILDGLVKQAPFQYTIKGKTVALSKKNPDVVPVNGVIKDTQGNPVPGVSLLVKGTTKGTSSDLDGNFTLDVSLGDVVVVNAVGYEPLEIVLRNFSALHNIIITTKIQELEELVVVGYGTQNKALVTGAVAQIGGEVLQNRPISRISQALQGQVPGLNIMTGTAGGAPNAMQSFNVRGYTGLGTSGAPLIVIDGVQGGSINSINPDDVERISVLKDAAAAAVYGSSAPYGVILITTKQGKKGRKPSITYNNVLGWADPINLPNMLNSIDFANLYNEAASNGGRGPIFNQETIDRMIAYQNGTIREETMVNPAPGFNAYLSWSEGSNANNDWFKIYFRNKVFNQQHNVGVSGGSENTTYYVGLGYNNRAGMYNYGQDQYNRYNVRTNITTQLAPWMEFSYRGAFSKELTNSPTTYPGKTGGNYMHQIARKWPNIAMFNPDGRYSDDSDVLLHEQGGRSTSTLDMAMLTGEFKLRLAPGWTATANYTFDAQFQDQNNHVRTLYSFRPDGSQYPVGGTFPNGFARSNYRNSHHVINAFSQYEKQYDDHFFSMLGGFVRDYTVYQSYNASNNQLYSNDIPYLAGTYGSAPSIGDFVRKIASDGFFGKFNYNYQEKYMLEFSGRYDATSRFLADVRWRFYPGVSAGWNINKEAFFEPLRPIVSSFKLRGSYGSLGDQAFLDTDPNNPQWYPFFPSLGTVSPPASNWLFGGNQQAAISAPGLINPALTWVTTTSFNLGTDLTLLNSRLGMSFDCFIRKSDDFAAPAEALPAVLGIAPPAANNAAMETRGFELSLSWRDEIGAVKYGVQANLSDYKGKVTRFHNPTGLLNNWYAGRMMGEIWGYETVGLFQNQQEIDQAPSQHRISGQIWKTGDVRYADVNGDGIIDFGENTFGNPGDRRIIGNNTPRYAFGFTGDLAWKNIDFMFFLQGIGKRDAWVGSNYFWGIVGDEWQSSPFSVHMDRWAETNPQGYFPRFYLTSENNKNTQTQTRYLQNAAYLRLKNIQIGYSLKQSLLEKVGFSRARFFAGVENVFTITSLIKTMDPELSIGDAKIYPLQRTYSAGLNLSF